MKIGVTYAVYVTNDKLLELALSTLQSINSDEHDLEFLGVLNAPVEARGLLEAFGPLIENQENCLSRAWNRGINQLLQEGCDYVFVPNLDIVLAKGALDRLIAWEKPDDTLVWTMAPWNDLDGIDESPIDDVFHLHPHFSAFMVDHRLFDEIGPFDENLKAAYNEDLDMHWRLRLAGRHGVRYEGSRFYHHGSATIRHDSELRERNGSTHAANDRYFVEKWGYKPPTADDPFTSTMYRHPFNDPARAGFEHQVKTTW